MNRRKFIAGLGSAAAWPVVALAQQDTRMRRIGALMSGDDDLDGKFRVSVFTQALADVSAARGRPRRQRHRRAA